MIIVPNFRNNCQTLETPQRISSCFAEKTVAATCTEDQSVEAIHWNGLWYSVPNHMWLSINGRYPKFLIYEGKSIYKWMIEECPHFWNSEEKMCIAYRHSEWRMLSRLLCRVFIGNWDGFSATCLVCSHKKQILKRHGTSGTHLPDPRLTFFSVSLQGCGVGNPCQSSPNKSWTMQIDTLYTSIYTVIL